MKFIYPEIANVFDTDIPYVNALIIENQPMLVRMLNDIQSQIEGADGYSVLSNGNKQLQISKNLELLSRFIPFEINQKALVNKVVSNLEKTAVSGEFYEKTVELLSSIERYLYDISFSFVGDIDFTKVSIGPLLKAVGVEFADTYDSISEKILDYIELVTEYDAKKLFILLNFRSFISDNEAKLFFDSILSHGYHVLMIENTEYPRLDNEKRFIVDADLCEIQ